MNPTSVSYTHLKSEVKEKMWPLPVSELFYVGHASLRKLSNLGIHTIGELAITDPMKMCIRDSRFPMLKPKFIPTGYPGINSSGKTIKSGF